MSRPLRLEFEGALYHITARGDRREPIVEDDADRQTLLDITAHGLDRFAATAFAYCLMTNHYHFVLQTHVPNLSRLMRHINGVYTQAYNRRHRKVGHLFQGRFKAVLVDEENYFLEVCRYVDLNPVRAGIVKRPYEWPWSSYRAHAAHTVAPAWLDSAALHRRLAPGTPTREGPRRYVEFVAQGRGVRLWDEHLSAQIYLGNAAFVERMQTRAASLEAKEIPRVQRKPKGHSLAWYFSRYDRNAAIVTAYRDGGHTQSAIAQASGLRAVRRSR